MKVRPLGIANGFPLHFHWPHSWRHGLDGDMGRMQRVDLRRAECRGGVALAHDRQWLGRFCRAFSNVFVDNLSRDKTQDFERRVRPLETPAQRF
jgi:hypothetical protein